MVDIKNIYRDYLRYFIVTTLYILLPAEAHFCKEIKKTKLFYNITECTRKKNIHKPKLVKMHGHYECNVVTTLIDINIVTTLIDINIVITLIDINIVIILIDIKSEIIIFTFRSFLPLTSRPLSQAAVYYINMINFWWS